MSDETKIFIDVTTGTWGSIADIVAINLDNCGANDAESDGYSLLAFLEGASDSEIQDFGKRYGKHVTDADYEYTQLMFDNTN